MAKEKLAIAVLGAGHIGGTLGKKWSVAGHEVRFSVNDPAGKNAQMELLDSIASLWFALAFGQKKGRHLAFKVLGM